jgi:hypothetical protein
MSISPQSNRMLIIALCLACYALVLSPSAIAQDALHSLDNDYYDLVALAGLVERPSIDYHSLSDQKWGEASGEHPWAETLRKRTVREAGPLSLQLYGPDSYSSYNSAYPHGMNDGALWQGVGLNTSLSAGFRLEAFGLSATLLPDIVWEENSDFEIGTVDSTVHPNPYSSLWSRGIDQPQRFGDASVFGFDWGNSELRYDLGPATLGFGTQAAWLGPGRRNAIILSDNASPFPKLDIGIRDTPTPIGNVEFRSFWGKLLESDYFDSDPTNDENLITGLTAAWSPKWTPGLSFAVHRTMLSKWSDMSPYDIFTLLWPFMSSSAGSDNRDQRASISADYMIPGIGFETYVEWARNDYSPNLDMLIRYPFHTQAYTLGARKLARFSDSLWLEILAELSNTESSRDYELINPTTFYGHSTISQGYTNEGQIIGAGIGTGGNSQYLGFTLYYPRGSFELNGQRCNRNSDYVFFRHFGQTIADKRPDEQIFNAELTFGIGATYFLGDAVSLRAGAAYCENRNPNYNPENITSTMVRNINLEFGASYRL